MTQTETPAPSIGKCVRCATVYRVAGDPRHAELGSEAPGFCGCAAAQGLPYSFVKWQQVKATYKASVRCDGRCHAAKSTKCVCECGGRNHGVALGS